MKSATLPAQPAPLNTREADYSSFLDHLSVKDKARIQKHEQSGNPQPFSDLWKRLAGTLAKLASHATEFAGSDAVRFYIADGKYRQQVFALERTKAGALVVFLPDILAEAVGNKLLDASPTANMFNVPHAAHLQIRVEPITADTPDMPACKNMLGWGKRALRIELHEIDDEKRIAAIEKLCQLAAQKWAAPAA